MCFCFFTLCLLGFGCFCLCYLLGSLVLKMRKKWGGKPLLREFWERVLTVARCRLSRVVFVQAGDLPTRYTTALPCILPLLARAPGYLSLLVAVYPGVLLVSGTVALPALGAYIKSLESRFLALVPSPSETAGRIWKLPVYNAELALQLGHKGSQEVWPRYASLSSYAVAPRLPSLLAWFRGFGSTSACRGLYRVELFTAKTYALTAPPPRQISVSFPTRPGGVWLSPHPFIHTEPLCLVLVLIQRDYFRVAHFPCSLGQ